MKKVLPLLLVGLMLAGCQMSDTQRYRAISNSYQVSANAVALAVKTGEIDNQNDLRKIKQINDEIKVELDASYEALTNDIPMDFQFAKARLEALLGRLIQYELQAEGE